MQNASVKFIAKVFLKMLICISIAHLRLFDKLTLYEIIGAGDLYAGASKAVCSL